MCKDCDDSCTCFLGHAPCSFCMEHGICEICGELTCSTTDDCDEKDPQYVCDSCYIQLCREGKIV